MTLEKIVIWLENNSLIAMAGIACIFIFITLITSVIIGVKRNKNYISEKARTEGEKAAAEAFEEKLNVAEKIENEDEVVFIEESFESVVSTEKPKLAEEKSIETSEPVIVKAKSPKKQKTESTFSPRKKSVTIIDPEYAKDKKSVQTKKIITDYEEGKQERRISGAKWEIHKSGDVYFYLLRATNGEILATSEAYATENGAKGGIKTLIKNIETGDVRIDQDKNDNFCFKVTSKQPFSRLLCVGQSYKYRKSAEGNLDAVKRLTAIELPIVNCVGETDSAHFDEIIVDVSKIEKSTLSGKWEVEKRADGKFVVLLKASNGVLVLKGEPRSSEDGCLTYVENIKKNLKVGTIKVQEDKNGQYCYKLYSPQKRIVCVGENYGTAQSAISSAESLARFAERSIFVGVDGTEKVLADAQKNEI